MNEDTFIEVEKIPTIKEVVEELRVCTSIQTRAFQDVQELEYDGSQLRVGFLRELYGYRTDLFPAERSCKDTLIGWFHGPCHVLPEGHMIDEVDIANNDPIHSNHMLHFIVEDWFDESTSVDIQSEWFRIIFLQRLLVRIIAMELKSRKSGINMRVEGDDIYLQGSDGNIDNKLSVSIATLSKDSSRGLIHVGLNLTREGTPEHLKIATLKSFDLVDDLESSMWLISGFANSVCEQFANEYDSAFRASFNTRMV